MNFRKHFTMSLVLTALAVVLTAACANAEPVLKGSFELPAAAYWGDTLLQPGQYSIWMSTEMRDMGHVPTIRITGEGVSKTFLTIARPEKESARNYLEVIDVGGTYVVRAFDAGMLGQSFVFGVSKNVKNKVQRAGARPEMHVPVASAGL